MPKSEEKADNTQQEASEPLEKPDDSSEKTGIAQQESRKSPEEVNKPIEKADNFAEEAGQLGEEALIKEPRQESHSRIPWISLGVAVVAMFASIAAIVLGQCHYSELTKPQAQLQEVNTKLSIVREKLERARTMSESSDNISGVGGDLQGVLDDGEKLVEEARTAILNSKYAEAKEDIEKAASSLDMILLPESQANFIPGAAITITAKPFEGWLSIGIGTGTTATRKDGELVDTITISYAMSVPTPDAVVLAYDIEPSDTTFSQPIAMTFHYLPANIPSGFREVDLVLASWDENASEWKKLPCNVDTIAHEITTSAVNHLTLFAVLALPPIS